MKYLILFLFLLVATTATSQNASQASLRWTSVTTFSAVTGERIDEATVLETSPKQITWKQYQGDVRHTFQVLQLAGTWTDVRQDGRITFNIREGDAAGTLTIQKENGVVVARIMLIVQGEPEVYELTIENII